MLLEAESPKDEPKPFRMARDVYKSCMDTEGIEALGIQPMKDILKQFGGWPGEAEKCSLKCVKLKSRLTT